ncbi:MAG: hypothetical protein AAF828_07995 [Bacteroidota bacterium]
MRQLLLTTLLLLMVAPAADGGVFATLQAQEKSIKTIIEQVQFDNQSSANDAAIKTISWNRGLVEPPRLQAKAGDNKKLYYNVDMEDGKLRLTTGDIYAAKLRYRLIDQLMEVEYGDRRYAMDMSMVRSFSIGLDNFILLADPMKNIPGRVIHQVHYVDDNYLVLEQHLTEEDFREKLNNVPTTDSQLFRRMSNTILVADGQATLVDSAKKAEKALRISKKSKAASYVKATKLKLRKATDLSQLVRYLAEQKSM